jgi:hypothetical protein
VTLFPTTPNLFVGDRPTARTAHPPSEAHNRADKRVFAKLCFVFVAELVKVMIIVVE